MKEFRKFISRGNVIELAVGLIIATYFGAIVKSLVNDIIMPPVGSLLGQVDFADLKYIIQSASPESKPGAGDSLTEVAISYGAFINHILTFMIVSFSIFMVLKTYNKMKDQLNFFKDDELPTAPPPPSREEALLTEIRDLLKKAK